MRDVLIYTATSPLGPCGSVPLSLALLRGGPKRWEVQLWFGGDGVLRGLENREQAASAEPWAHMLSEQLEQKAGDLETQGRSTHELSYLNAEGAGMHAP